MSVSERGKSNATVFIVATILIDAIGFGIVIPVLPRLVMEVGQLDLPAAIRVGGWLSVVYALMQFLCGPLAGNLGDRFGRRPVLLLSLAGLAVDYVLMGFAHTLALLFLGRLIAGVFGASFSPATAALADITAPEDRAKRFGLVGAAFGIGFILGPALGGILGEFGHRMPFYAAAICSALNFTFGFFFFPETLPPEKRRPFSFARANPVGALLQARKMRGVLGLSGILLLWNIASMVYPATWSFFAIAQYGWSNGMIGLSLALAGISMAVVQATVLGRVIKRFRERRTAMIGVAVAAFGYLGYALVPYAWFGMIVIVITALQALVQPSITALMSQRAPADAQGEMQGFIGSLNAVGAIAAPLLLNPALAWFTGPDAPVHFPGAAFVIASAFAFAALLSLAMTRRIRDDAAVDQMPSATGA
ncbi:major facilitator superfamily MFS_1 [Rhizorhabdus wittichii RW1]|uniref:Major facilitator superfamily MFS_1 n=2 Tax=Rhizorhabdus wittichii TaxID=160791 RepID=A0A9J9HGV0_RHIWR|nr:tetracycline resistance MFS efflux pump [Rhizorhabdus wittichii]ABQ71172.1 major facilitator superfamily MFS_1 [Rhizorhabdus wittichii RW1]QTH22247.1 tetracycline resistance MFS efflux pump [Rhizorhabdus wittichii]